MKITLTAAQKIELERQHKIERDKRLAERIKVVRLLAKGWLQRQIAQALLINESTIAEHLNDYVYAEGKLKPENGGSISKSSFKSTGELIAHLEDNTYTSTLDINCHVQRSYGVTSTQQGMDVWLLQHGSLFKKPKVSPATADPIKQQPFIHAYNLLKNITPVNEPMLFIDSAQPTQATKVSYGWIKAGTDKLIATTASCTRLNIIGAINWAILEVTHNHYASVSAETTIDFLRLVEAKYPPAPRIHVLLDQSGYHYAQEVARLAMKLQIILHFLPAHSPNFNPIERLWKAMNEKVRNNKIFATTKQFKSAIVGFFTQILPNIKEELQPRINDNFHILNPGSSI
jgi:transposase